MKVLLNALIIIVVAHIILSNIEEEFTTGLTYRLLGKSDEKLDGVEETVVEEEEIENFQNDLLEYMNNVDYEVEPYQNSVANDLVNTPPNKMIQPSNYYEEEVDKIDNGEPANPNFKPGITNLNKYFTSLKPQELTPVDKSTNEPFFVEDKDNGCATSSLRWKYKDEQVQNGGDFLDGITAFNDGDDAYAVYDTSGVNLQSLNDISIPGNSDIATINMI